MNIERIDQLIEFALAAASQEDFDRRELGPIHLIKLVYLADLAYAAEHEGETFTGVPWQFYHYGPWHAAVNGRVEPVALRLNARKRTFSGSGGMGTRYRLSGSDDENSELFDDLDRTLPLHCSLSIRRGIRKYGDDTYGLLHDVYKTTPMRHAAPHQLLDFKTAVERSSPVAVEKGEDSKVSARARRRRKAKQEAMRAQIRQAVEEKKAAKVTQPLYDDIFFEGLAWLDRLAGGPILEMEGTLEFQDDIWNSDIRKVDELP